MRETSHLSPITRPTVRKALRTLREGELVAARHYSEDVVVARVGHKAFVLPDACPHDGRPLSDGFIENGRIVCSRHGREYDPASGKCLVGKDGGLGCPVKTIQLGKRRRVSPPAQQRLF